MLIESLVELYVGFHSYLCFSHLENCFEKLAQLLLDTLLPCYLSSFSSIFLKRKLDTSSIPGGSIEKAFASSIAPRHLLDRSSFILNLTLCCSIASSIPQLLKTRSLIPTSTDTSIPLDIFIYWDLLAAYIRPLCDPDFISLRSLSLSLSILLCFSPKTISSYSKLVPQGFFKLFQVSPYLVSS